MRLLGGFLELKPIQLHKRYHIKKLRTNKAKFIRIFPWSPVNCVRPGGAVYDMVYGSEPTPLVLAARSTGLAAADGLGMLAGQGEESFRLWFGAPPPPGLMRATLESLRRGK